MYLTQTNKSNRVIPWLATLMLAGLLLWLLYNMLQTTAVAAQSAVAAQPAVDKPVTASATSTGPFWYIFPNPNGSDLYIQVTNTPQLTTPVTFYIFGNQDGGPSNYEKSYAPTYSDTARFYEVIATGLAPHLGFVGTINLSTTANIPAAQIDLSRHFVAAATTAPSLISKDNQMELIPPAEALFSTDTYLVLAENLYPPAPISRSVRFISKFYTLTSSGLLPQSDHPFGMSLRYHDWELATADKFNLDIFAWDTDKQQWTAQNANLLINPATHRPYLATSSNRFTTYALGVAPRWYDSFHHLEGLQSRTNVTIARQTTRFENLALTTDAITGTAVSQPITPTFGIMKWGVLSFQTADAPGGDITVDILSTTGEVLYRNVSSGTDFSDLLNPALHRAIQLRVNLTRTLSTDPSPQLLDWRMTWQEASDQTASIKGWIDTAVCEQLSGWAGDMLNPNQAIDVHIYEEPADIGQLLAIVPANLPAETAVCNELDGSNCAVCPTNQPQCQHRYWWEVPASLKDGRLHHLYAYGVNPVTGQHNQLLGTPSRLTCPPTVPQFESIWDTNQNRNNTAAAWSDFDNDGDLDLAFGNSDAYPVELYRNDNGTLIPIPGPTEPDRTLDLAWGDFDGDGDQDLAVGNGNISDTGNSQNRIYRHDGLDASGNPILTLIWTSAESELTTSVAWGDVDNDGILELAVGNGGVETLVGSVDIPAGHSNRLYRYTTALDGSATFESAWESAEADLTLDVAWADVNGDGLLDLAAANAGVEVECDLSEFKCETASLGQHNRLYLNENGMLGETAVWSSDEADPSSSLAWGDYDNDGDPDLAVGNFNGRFQASLTWGGDLVETTGEISGHSNHIYRNDNGQLTASAIFTTTEQDATTDVAWGDYDNDGDLDLAVANTATTLGSTPSPADFRNRIYRNSGWVLEQTAVWSSTESEFSFDVAWGDVDNDGDLDLAVANGDFDQGQPSRLYRNDSVALGNSATWSSAHSHNSFAIALADIDSNGSLDILVGNGGRTITQANQFYRNQGGAFVADDLAWPNLISDTTTSLAPADIDGDFDLDLVVGNNDQPNRLYRNTNGVLLPDPAWAVTVPGTTAVAWADIDNDGDLDLAIGSRFAPLALYLNQNGTLSTTPAWQAPTVHNIWTIAFGDADGDGYVDLAVGSRSINEPVRLYQNLGMGVDGVLQLVEIWQSAEQDVTYSLAWGDINQDGYLDLAVGNDSGPNRVYANVNGRLQPAASWSSHESDATHSIALGDYDGDGDLDLAAGNRLHVNRLYRNEGGELGETAVWSSTEADATTSVAWGDVDNDGDLDLIAANDGNPLRLYINPRHSNRSPLNDPPFAVLEPLGQTAEADFFSASEQIQGNVITITYTLYDDESDSVPRLLAEYSANGGGHWQPATAVTPTQLLNLPTAPWPLGRTHQFSWHVAADLIQNDNVRFRLRPQPAPHPTPVLWGAVGSQSAPFRVEAPFYIRVTDENGRPIPNIPVYANGQTITSTLNHQPHTNNAGLLNPGSLPSGTILTALAPQPPPNLPSSPCRTAPPYRTHLTNIAWNNDNSATLFTTHNSGQQHVVVRDHNPLVLFNLVVSVEWDADEQYLSELATAMSHASHYLYDATDGQMALASVTLFDEGTCWLEADLQVAVSNAVIPHAYINAIHTNEPGYMIHLGRAWDGTNSDQGSWANPSGFRTIIHEFGHYALALYDEYGTFNGQPDTYCTQPWWDMNEANDHVAASIMSYHYLSSEFGMRGVSGLWDDFCEQTRQFIVHGQSDWETIVEVYADPAGRWQFTTPQDRGTVLSGPSWPAEALPDFPVTTIHNPNSGEPTRYLTVVGPTPDSIAGLQVNLERGTKTFTQGFTNNAGKIEIYGAAPGNILRVSTGLNTSEAIEVTTATALTLTLGTNGRLSPSTSLPHLRLWPSTTPNQEEITLNLDLYNFSNTPLQPIVLLRPPTATNGNAVEIGLAYSPNTMSHSGHVTLPKTEQGVGQLKAADVSQRQIFHATYRLQRLEANTVSDAFSSDGRLHLALSDNALTSETNLLILSSPTLPGLPTGGATVHGYAYDITASGGLTQFAQPVILTMAYQDIMPDEIANLAVYWWNAQTGQWEKVPSTLDEGHQQLTAVITNLGVYTLMQNN